MNDIKCSSTPELMFVHRDEAIKAHMVQIDVWEGMSNYSAVSKSWNGMVKIWCGLEHGWVEF